MEITPLKVNNVPTVHLNRINSPSAGTSLEKNGWARIPRLTLYLPKKLDIDSILRKNKPDFIYNRDKFVYILHLIYAIPAQKKKAIEEYTGYTSISKKILGSIIKDYRKYIDYLKEQNIIEEDNYIVGLKCGGLRFSEKYRSKLKPVDITKWTLIKNLQYLRKEINQKATTELYFLKKWLENLDVDISKARDYLSRELAKDELNGIGHSLVRYNSRLLPIERLSAKNNISFFVDNTAGRLHTPITQLKSELRKHLKWKGKVLYSVDISNSQPYLLQSLMNVELFERCNMTDRINAVNPAIDTARLKNLIASISSKKDVISFNQIVTSGRFYENFGKLLKENGELIGIPDEKIKEKVKEIIFTTFFSKNTAIRYRNVIKLFKRTFPNVYKVISTIKKDQHNTLAVILQNLEADIILNNVCKKLDKKHPEVPLFTLHDSVITTEDNVELVEKTIQQTMKKFFDKKVSLKIERWE
ncbi:hypothetical protein [Chryseobacterium jejuense]|uniref:hypothetical protein n=1 Tax=Chryseobacterium jejuense TaxID=445960 RepID=UPI001AE18023|nr:hypothetical protein [Chryseobacterium jejuense]MBP2619111.1 hypothetical protein [Chryseobacterium jejuense]